MISKLIESYIPDGAYDVEDLVHAMIEITLDMIAIANSREQQALFVEAVSFLADGIRDIRAGQYKTKQPDINDVQGNA
jgi:hypothetical protein